MSNCIKPIVKIAKRHMSKEAYKSFLEDLEVFAEKGETPDVDA